MYYCMSEKLYPGSLSCLFNARENKKNWKAISGSMLFFDDSRLYGIRKGNKTEEIDRSDGHEAINYDNIDSLDGVIFECATRERLHRDFFFMWRKQIYHCVDADNYICDKYDL